MLSKWVLIGFFVSLLMVGCINFENKQLEEEYETKPIKTVDVGLPVEKIEKKEVTEKIKVPLEEKKEEAPPEKNENEEKAEEELPVCEKDMCLGNVIQHCILGKATFNSTCAEVCKDGKCVEKELTGEEFFFKDIYVGKALGSRKQILIENDLKVLAPTKISTANGLTEVKYLLRFGGDSDDAVESGKMVYEKNRANKVGEYLKFSQGEDIFEYVFDFSRGLESKIGADNKLDEIIGAKLFFFGLPYQLVDAETDQAQKRVTLLFLRGGEAALLEDGAKQTFTSKDKEYEVEIVFVDSKTDKARVSVNGKVSPDLRLGSIFSVDNLFSVAVKDIFTDKTEKGEKEVIELFIGADQLEFTDNDVTNNQFERNVKVNGKSLSRGKAMIRAGHHSGTMRIDMLKYRTETKGKESDIFLAPKEGLRSASEEPEALLTTNWDLIYDGLEEMKTQPLELTHRNARSYTLSFLNKDAKSYTIPLIDSTNALKFGDDDNDLIFVENSVGNIDRDDYFILTDSNNENGLTAVYQLISLDRENKKIEVKDLAGGIRDASYTVDAGGSGTGTLNLGGKSYSFLVPSTGNALGIDLNGNGNIGNDRVMIVAAGGLILDLGTNQDISSKTTHDLLLTTGANKLKEKQENEDVKLTVTKGDEITLTIADQPSLHLESVGTDTLKGMTAYGALYQVTGSAKKELRIDYPPKQRLATAHLDITKR